MVSDKTVRGFDELAHLMEKFEQRDKALRARIETLEQRSTSNTGASSGLTAEVDALRNTVSDLKSLVLGGAFKSTDDLARYGGFSSEEQAKDFGLWALATIAGRPEAKQALAGRGKGLAESVNSTGGALVPEEFSRVLIDLLQKYGVFRRNARVIPMSTDRLILPKINSDVTVYSPGESGTITESNPTFSNVQLVANKLCSLTAISSELEEDAAVSVGVILADSIARDGPGRGRDWLPR